MRVVPGSIPGWAREFYSRLRSIGAGSLLDIIFAIWILDLILTDVLRLIRTCLMLSLFLPLLFFSGLTRKSRMRQS